MPTLEYKLTVWKNYNISEEILEEDGRGETNIIIMGEWNSKVGDKSYKTMFDHIYCEGEIRLVKCTST